MLFLFCLAEALSAVRSGSVFAQIHPDVTTAAPAEASNNSSLKEEIYTAFRPREDSLSLLALQLNRYRVISAYGGWPEIPDGVLLGKGIVRKAVAILRQRLALESYLSRDRMDREKFDEEVVQAVSSFQQQHGLKPDGVVGPMTLKELNVSATERADQILVNMERIRRFSGSPEDSYILVNIPDFKLSVIENGRPVITMKVVVGKPYWDTAVFSAKMTYLIINPYWDVPPSIVSREILSHVKKDPDYLIKKDFMIFKGWNEKTEIVDPAAINWQKVSVKNIPYRFRQLPGPSNPLGRLKFMFPNKFNIYLHDTPARGLFDRGMRAFSHGCIRIEKPLELARYLLRAYRPSLQFDLDKALATGREQTVNLTRPIDVHIIYLTAWPDDEGRTQFRRDIYDRDAKLLEELKRKSLNPEDDFHPDSSSAFLDNFSQK
ncbi:MAG: L,D-transpeptidase family protein, partial [Deltaproteobacteria bacterium]